MQFTVTMPKLSPTMEEGTIAKWHKKEGDKVQAGELLLEVATDKATVEYNSLDEGFLRKIIVQDGGRAQVNAPIAVLTESKDEPYELPQEKKEPDLPTDSPEKKEEKESPQKEAKTAVQPAMQQPAFVPEPPLSNYQFPFPDSVKEKTKASPLAKKLAKEKGLDLTSIKGTGPGGRITSDDLDLAQPDRVVGFGGAKLPIEMPGSFEEIPLSPMRRVIAQRLQQAKTYIPHIYVTQHIDATPMIDLREQLKTGGVKVTFNDFVIRAVSLALKEHPEVNSGFNSVNQTIIRFKTIDISVAVTVDGGLITPIIRHADFKNLGEISTEIKELATRARLGKLAPEEYKGGSFTISNMGMLGVSDFSAIINPPQAAILAIGGIEEVPVVKNKEVVAGNKMTLVLSADHRVLDGTDAAKFIKTVQKYLENPALLCL